ncbi:McrC family protein [Deinococcus petrolearius]|uniref:McrC family protein n=1 Tax=Deinococcus petrolearius TaxID=1751295 RepID=A0ABW1DNQ6_9DEIO
MTYIIAREYDLLVRGAAPGAAGIHGLPPESFDALRAFLQTPVEGHKGQEEVIARPTLRGNQPALRLQQWVGVIRTPDGTTVELLPKTHERDGEADGETVAHSRALLFRMLAAAGDNYRAALPADLDPAQMRLFEVVLRYALEVLRAAIRRGVPHAYREVQEERAGLRGRLDLSRQLRQPPHRVHLLHVTYDEFLPDRPETRLVRLAVERIARMTARSDSRRLARELLHALAGVPASRDVRRDFTRWKLERGYTHFAPSLDICRLILNELNPLTAGTASRVTAVLFDMNRVYETYVAQLLRLQHPDWQVQTQVKGQHLGSFLPQPSGQARPVFALRPDLIVHPPGQPVIIADTKWKRLKADRAFPHGVGNADAYQMLAYSEIFQPEPGQRRLCLIYPYLPGLPNQLPDIQLPGGRTLRVVLVDLHQDTPTVNLELTFDNIRADSEVRAGVPDSAKS